MSGSGNMIPQSRTTMRPSTSMQAQLRPISPSPPRKTTRTGLALAALPPLPPLPPLAAVSAVSAVSAKRGDRDRRRADGRQDLGRLGVEFGRRRPHGQAALSDP